MSTADVNVTDEVNEFVFAEWLDPRTGRMTLGYLSAVNKQSSQFTLKIGLDGSQLFARFVLWVSFKRAGRNVRQELILVIPLKAFSQRTSPPLRFENVNISDIGEVAAAVQDAGLSTGGSIIRAQFDLTEVGHILMPATKAEKIRPSTEAARTVLVAFQSFSKALSFTVYMKPSDYATKGLRTICQHLQHRDALEQLPLVHSDMYMGKGAEILNWDRCELFIESPPPYVNECQPLPPTPPSRILTSIFSDQDSDVLVRASPTQSQTDSKSTSPSETEKERYLIPSTPNADPVSFVAGEDISFISQTEEIECRPKRHLDSPKLIGSKRLRQDEYCSFNQISVSNRQPRNTSVNDVSSEIVATFSTWIAKALAVNETIYNHSRLQPFFRALRQQGRNPDESAFDALQAHMTAAFFYNPQDDANDEELECAPARTFLNDIERLGKWMICEDRLAHVTMFGEMLELGKAARSAVRKGAIQPSAGIGDTPDVLIELARYNGIKASCISFVMIFLGEDERG